MYIMHCFKKSTNQNLLKKKNAAKIFFALTSSTANFCKTMASPSSVFCVIPSPIVSCVVLRVLLFSSKIDSIFSVTFSALVTDGGVTSVLTPELRFVVELRPAVVEARSVVFMFAVIVVAAVVFNAGDSVDSVMLVEMLVSTETTVVVTGTSVTVVSSIISVTIIVVVFSSTSD